MKEVFFAGGSFWGVQKYFDLIDGVVFTEVCYVNGKEMNVKYIDVSRGSGHAEAVYVVYNPKIISLGRLLQYYYNIIDPTSLNHQGDDYGYQYRTGIYYKDKADVEVIVNSLDNLQKLYSEPIVVEVSCAENVVIAEEYQQKFLMKNPFGYCHIPESVFNDLLKESQCVSRKDLSIINGDIREKAYKNSYFDNFEEGIYVDVKNKKPLFLSKDKYEYDCGYPTFSKPIDDDRVIRKTNCANFIFKSELRAKDSGISLGVVFNDGPKEFGGDRYCINSAALKFIPKDMMTVYGYQDYLKYLE